MISYAQNHEDVLLQRAFAGQAEGFFIDVGANDPVQLSVTKHFSNLGWRGINVEPGPAAFARLCADRPRDINLNVGIASRPGTLTLYECPANDALSTFSEDQAAEHRAAGHVLLPRAVPVRTLADVCSENVSGAIDFLSIDVEGFEREVLTGADLKRWRPRVIVIEATRPVTAVSTRADWAALLEEAGYVCACFDGLNEFHVRDDEPQLRAVLAVPVNITDRFESFEMHRLRQQLDEKHQALHASLFNAAALTRQVEEKEAALNDKQAALIARDRDLRELGNSAGDLQRRLQEIDGVFHSTSAQLHAQLDERNSSIAALQAVLQQRDSDLTLRDADLRALQSALETKHAALHQALHECSQLQHQLEEKHAELLGIYEHCRFLKERPFWDRLRNVG